MMTIAYCIACAKVGKEPDPPTAVMLAFIDFLMVIGIFVLNQ